MAYLFKSLSPLSESSYSLAGKKLRTYSHKFTCLCFTLVQFNLKYFPLLRQAEKSQNGSITSYICEKFISQEVYLYNQLIKSGPFSSYCGKSFKSLEGRKLCERKCSGNNPIFECPTCNKKISNKPRLLAHMKTHTGERDIGCPFPGCTSAYYTKTNLTTHIKLTHKLVPKEVFAKYGPPLSL